MSDDARPVVILTALNLEYQAVRQHLTELRRVRHPTGTIFELGRIGDSPIPVAIAVIGEGNSLAAVLAERATSAFAPRALLMVGVAGSLRAEISIGDVLVATRVHAYHGGKETSSGFGVRPRSWDASHLLEQAARHVAISGTWTALLPPADSAHAPEVHFKPIAAGEIVLDSRDSPLARLLRASYNDAAAIETEGAGISQAGHLGAVPTLLIRGISDRADGDKHAADAGGSQLTAASHAAAFALTVARELGDDQVEGPGGSSQDQVRSLVSPWSAPAPLWTPLAERLEVSWLSQLDVPSSASLAALELHLVPAGPGRPPEASGLARLRGQLASIGRAQQIFGPDDEVMVADPALAVSATGNGLAVASSGQRSAWLQLPRDELGAIVREADLSHRLAIALDAILGLDMPEPSLAGLAVGLTSTILLCEGDGVVPPGTNWRPRTSAGPIRVPAWAVVDPGRIAGSRAEVVAELAARLLQAFRTSLAAPSALPW